MIAVAVYAAVVTVLLIVALCFLVVLVQDQKELVRRAVDKRLEQRAENRAALRIALGLQDDLSDVPEPPAGLPDPVHSVRPPRAKPGS